MATVAALFVNGSLLTPAGVPTPINVTDGVLEVDAATADNAGAGSQANTQVTATGTAATLVIARATRRSCLIVNTHATASCWIGAATVTTSNGFKLGPGAGVSFTFTGLIQVIDDGATHPVLSIFDEYG